MLCVRFAATERGAETPHSLVNISAPQLRLREFASQFQDTHQWRIRDCGMFSLPQPRLQQQFASWTAFGRVACSETHAAMS